MGPCTARLSAIDFWEIPRLLRIVVMYRSTTFAFTYHSTNYWASRAMPAESRLLQLPTRLRQTVIIPASTHALCTRDFRPTRSFATFPASRAAEPHSSVNDTEVSHFNALAASWWDPHGPSRLLHLMNPLRHDFIKECLARDPPEEQERALKFLDIGCGAGIFAESAARSQMVDSVTAIDPTPEVIAVARRHQREDPSLLENGPSGAPKLRYVNTAIEGLHEHGHDRQSFDVVTLFEVVEHIQRPAPFLKQCVDHLRPGGWLIGSTIARTNTSWFTTKFMAEEVIRMVPRGTHEWSQYLQPEELRAWANAQTDLSTIDGFGWNVMGVVYVPGLGWRKIRGSETWGNYFFAMQKRR